MRIYVWLDSGQRMDLRRFSWTFVSYWLVARGHRRCCSSLLLGHLYGWFFLWFLMVTDRDRSRELVDRQFFLPNMLRKTRSSSCYICAPLFVIHFNRFFWISRLLKMHFQHAKISPNYCTKICGVLFFVRSQLRIHWRTTCAALAEKETITIHFSSFWMFCCPVAVGRTVWRGAVCIIKRKLKPWDNHAAESIEHRHTAHHNMVLIIIVDNTLVC